jgi:transposase-like protein
MGFPVLYHYPLREDKKADYFKPMESVFQRILNVITFLAQITQIWQAVVSTHVPIPSLG